MFSLTTKDCDPVSESRHSGWIWKRSADGFSVSSSGHRNDRNSPSESPSGEPTALCRPLAESVIVGYYTSRRKCIPIPQPSATQQKVADFYGQKRRNRPYQRQKCGCPGQGHRQHQKHNEREKDSYRNPDIIPERLSYNVHFKKPSASYTELFAQMESSGTISTRD